MAEIEVIDAHTHILRSEQHCRELYSYFLGFGPMNGFPLDPPSFGTVPEIQKLMSETGVAHTNFLMMTWSGRYYRDGLFTLPEDPVRREGS